MPDIVGPPDPFSKKRKRQESTESSYDPSASLFSDGHETSCVIKLNPPLKPLSVDLTETFSDSEDEVEMSHVFKPDTQKKAANLQKTITFSTSEKDNDPNLTGSSPWPSPPSSPHININPRPDANISHLETIDSNPGSPMDTSTPLDSENEQTSNQEKPAPGKSSNVPPVPDRSSNAAAVPEASSEAGPLEQSSGDRNPRFL